MAGASAPAARPVKLISVGAGQDTVSRQFFGQVVARQTVDLAFQVSGQIVRFPVAEGEQIAAGSLVAELDLEPFNLQLEQAQLQFDQAERTLERLNRLGSSVSEVSREDAETRLGSARVALRNAQYALDHARLLAPIDALVASRNVADFTTIAQGSPVVRLHDMSELRIDIDVPDILFQHASKGANVTLSVRFSNSDQTYPLEVREFNAEASSIGQTFRITLGLPRPEGLIVFPGSSVTVIVASERETPALHVPASALRIGNDGSMSVMRFVPGEDEIGTLERVAVEVEADRNGSFNIVAGLEPGDEIVMTGAHAIEDGALVRRFTGFSN